MARMNIIYKNVGLPMTSSHPPRGPLILLEPRKELVESKIPNSLKQQQPQKTMTMTVLLKMVK
eukprot:Pgem_evm1s8450